MSENIFVALENPRSMLGYHKEKQENYPTIDRKEKHRFDWDGPVPETRGDVERANRQRDEKYKNRKAYLNEKGFDPFSKDELREKDRELAEAYCKMNPKARLAQAGSLASLMKRLIWYKERQTCCFHTVIFLGHGNESVMAVGTGRVSLSEEGRELFGADKREISVANTSVWVSYFTEAAKLGCFEVDTDERFHLFLLGCLTAAAEKASIVDIMAVQLRQILNKKVAVYGPTAPIGAKETEAILDKLDKLKKNGPRKVDIEIGELEKGYSEEDDPLSMGAVFLHCKVID